MMNKLGGSALLLGLLLAGMSGMSVADRGHGGYGGHANVGVGIVFNPFWFGSWYYPGPYYYPPYYAYSPYYYPPMVTAPATPPVYIEREAGSPPASQASAYWYYCADPQGYYPYVKECPGGWQAVAPQPPDLSREEK
jgi:hypothetical protein